MAFPQGINFRATAGFVSDGTNEDHEISTTADYPFTTAQGNTVGWEQAPDGTRDRNAGIDRRLAGLHFETMRTINFRFDLPASGSYNVRLSSGDAAGADDALVDLYDSASLLAHLANQPNETGFVDATNTQYSSANWPGSNTALNATFTTTICRFRLLASVTGGVSGGITHAYVESAGGGGGAGIQIRRRNRSGTRFGTGT